MDLRETIAMLTWVNQVDPRVMLNEAAAETWQYAMRSLSADVAKQAILEHYKAHESIAASPGAISKRAANIKTSRDAKTRAVGVGPSGPRHPSGWRANNPDLWDELFERGRLQANEERQRASDRRVAA